MDGLTTRQKNILAILKQKQGYLTSQEISTKIGVSIRTVKSEINFIGNRLCHLGIKIVSKNGKGYCLFSENENSLNLLNIKDINNMIIPNDTKSRVNYIIRKLLISDKFIKVDELSADLFISRSSFNSVLKEVKNKLDDFNIKVISKPNYGIKIKGNETDVRLAVSEYYFYQNEILQSELSIKENLQKNSNKILEIIIAIFNEYKIEISEFMLNNLVNAINVQIIRCKNNNFVTSDSFIDELAGSFEFVAASAIVKLMEFHFDIYLNINETLYVAKHIKAKRIIEKNELNEKETKKLNDCINLIFSEINNNFELNFTKDSELYDHLFLHIPQMITRLHYHMPTRNPLANDYMRRYLFATKVTHSACGIIEQFYKIKVDINEFGYLLLYFNLAISKFETDKQIRIGILQNRGRVESLMYYNEICEHFSSHKYNIEIINHINNANYDLLISTFKINNVDKEKHYIISGESYLDEINEKINKIRYKNINLNNYFREEYCDFEVQGENKEDVLNNFYKILLKKNIINEMPNDYNCFVDDELGNGIVHFQDSFRIVRKSLCYVCTLKKPIFWKKENVRILILTKTKKDTDKDLYNLCRIVSKWCNDIKKVSEFLKKQTFNVLLEGIKKI